jgi:hypothetical protein
MNPERMKFVCKMYIQHLETENIPMIRMPVNRHPQTTTEMLSHAHYLLDGIVKLADNPEKFGKANRHLGSAQTLLWVAGLYTLQELMDHNCPDK